MKKHRTPGFSIIELLIAIVIIAILAAISVAGLLAARRSANEASAVSSLRNLHGAQSSYLTSFGDGEYAGDVGSPTLAALTALNGRNLVDDVLGSGAKSGYEFVGGRE